MAANEARRGFGTLLDDAQHGPVGIERDGRPVAVVVSAAEYERLTAYREQLYPPAAEGHASPEGEVAKLLPAGERREAEEELEAELLKGLTSGPAAPFSRADWAEIDRLIDERVTSGRRHSGSA